MAEFDKFAQTYLDETVKDLGRFGKYKNTALQYKCQYLRHILAEEPKGILDFGCGVGLNIPYLREYFPNTNLFGCDISQESIKIASNNYTYCNFSVINTPVELEQFKDKITVAFASTVLHHIRPEEHQKWIIGLSNAINAGGYLMIFEHNMRNPITAKIVKKSKIDKDAIMLDADYCKSLVKSCLSPQTLPKTDNQNICFDNVKLRYTYFFPWRSNFFTMIERLLFFIPFGAQYCVYAKKFLQFKSTTSP